MSEGSLPRVDTVRNWPRVPAAVQLAQRALAKLEREHELIDLELLEAEGRGHVVPIERLQFELFEKHLEIKSAECALRKEGRAWRKAIDEGRRA